MRMVQVLYVLLLTSSCAAAQNVKFTLGQCLDFAINNNYSAHRANLDVSEASCQINEARSKVLPQINVSGVFDHGLALPTTMLPGELIGEVGTQIPVQMGSKNELDVEVYVEQIIFSPGLFTGVKIAKNNHELQKLRATMTQEEIIFNVSHVFYDILNSRQELENIRYMESMQDSLYRLMENRTAEKEAREVDLNRIKVSLNNLRAKSRNINNTILQQKRYLQILIGLPVEAHFEVDDSNVKDIGMSEFCSFSQSPNIIELDVLNKQKEIVGLEIHRNKMEYMPTLSAIATAGHQFQSDRLNLTKEPWYSSAIVGVRLTIPIFDGWGKRSKIRQKQSQLRNLEWQIQETRQKLSADYMDAINQMQTTYELVRLQSENLKLAERAYMQTMALYAEGLASVTDLLETETSLYEVKIAYTTELIRYKKAEIDLRKTTGTLISLLSNG